MKKEKPFKDLSGMELLILQSEVMSRTREDTEFQEQIYEELKRRRSIADKINKVKK